MNALIKSGIYMEKKNINLIGIGLGNPNLLTMEAINAISVSDIIIGAKRIIESVKPLYIDKHYIVEYKTDKILEIIKENKSSNISVLFSGDLSLFSGSQKLYSILETSLKTEDELKHFNVRTFPGISSLSYMCSKSNIDISKVKILSFHGKSNILYHNIVSNEYTFIITSNADGVKEICRRLLSFGLSKLKIILGENLSYTDEKITVNEVKNILNSDISDLNCMIIQNPDVVCGMIFGLADDLFIRDKIPMTKSEVRAIILSKLGIRENSICYDIGAGSGSVSIEMARLAPKGFVYAIEQKEAGIELIKKNIEKFNIENIETIHIKAPLGLDNINDADCIFIGGSGGELVGIMSLIFDSPKHPTVVISAITLETVADMSKIIKLAKSKGFKTEVTSISVSKSKEVGEYNMMIAYNPVFIAKISG